MLLVTLNNTRVIHVIKMTIYIKYGETAWAVDRKHSPTPKEENLCGVVKNKASAFFNNFNCK